MKTEYQYLVFVKGVTSKNETIWACKTKRSGDELGIIEYYVPWRQWCYSPSVRAVYSEGCLKDIADFCRQVNEVKNVETR